MIKNYIFDFGNVITRFCGEELTALTVKDKAMVKSISEVVFDRLYWSKLDDGTITDEEVKAGFAERLSGEALEYACAVYDSWIEKLSPIDGMRELIADIKKSGGKLYILSNISKGFAAGYRKNPWINELFDTFDGLVFSAPLGITKPGAEIFNHLLSLYNLTSGECVFIDDSQANVDGAKAVGINAYLFDGDAAKLRRALGL